MTKTLKKSDRKFYQTQITIEVLSQEVGPEECAMQELAEQCDSGSWSGDIKEVVQTEVDGAKMAELLQAQGTDPGFFNLTKDGEDNDG